MCTMPAPLPPDDPALGKHYVCPTCRAESHPSKYEAGWVKCPMVRDLPICRGCCADFQSAARSDDFDGHPYRDLFVRLENKTNKDLRKLRLICLEHQENIVHAGRERAADPATTDDMERALRAIETAKNDVWG